MPSSPLVNGQPCIYPSLSDAAALFFSVGLTDWNVFRTLLLPPTGKFVSEKHTSPQHQAMPSSGASESPLDCRGTYQQQPPKPAKLVKEI